MADATDHSCVFEPVVAQCLQTRSEDCHHETSQSSGSRCSYTGGITGAWLANIGRANGSHDADAAIWTKIKRDGGDLLGVWSATDHTYRYPSFQFYADGTLRPRVRELLIALANIPDYSPLADPSGWRRAFWLYGSSHVPDGSDSEPRARADVFVEDPDTVIQLAHSAAIPAPSW